MYSPKYGLVRGPGFLLWSNSNKKARAQPFGLAFLSLIFCLFEGELKILDSSGGHFI